MNEPLSPEKLGQLFETIDNEPTGKLSELAKIAGLSIAEDYIGADLSSEDLSADNLGNANLSNANLSDANLSHTNLSYAKLSNANLSNANLSHTNLSHANLSNANLSDANLSHTNLSHANLSDANLSHANLSYANLSDANLRHAKLVEANLANIDLANAKLVEANLIGADLSNANLLRANLTDIDLGGANVKNAQFDKNEGIFEAMKSNLIARRANFEDSLPEKRLDVPLKKNTITASQKTTTTIKIEDDRTGMSKETLKRAFLDNLFYIQGINQADATNYDYYVALAYTIRDRLLHRFLKSIDTYKQNKDTKLVCYLSAEFLMGRHLGNNLVNLDIYQEIENVIKDLGLDLEELIEQEPDPGLGNGGLGRLAACFLDSLASLEIPAIGYGIRYEFGIFHQLIRDGWQAEVPDNWLKFGNPWELARPDETVEIKLGGHTENYDDNYGNFRVSWIPDRVVVAIPHDTLVSGYKTNTVNPLRLWKAEANEDFNFDAFNSEYYDQAVQETINSETISKVLYPNDNNHAGKELRFVQQYFFVSASLQDLIRIHLRNNESLDNLHERVAIQLNDTHPAIAVAELMRLFMDEHRMDWDTAWSITQQTLSYTNYTLMPEALEKWPVSLFEKLLPRHLEIIYRINHFFIEDIRAWYPDRDDLVQKLSLIEQGEEKKVRMANLACLGSHAINGVAALHTEILKQDTLSAFAFLFPDKFFNKTNGVTPRRWILLSNPKLSKLITEKIGDGWLKDLSQMRALEKYADDSDFGQQWRDIKKANKERLAQYIFKTQGIEVDTNSIFDVLVKRIHEYKRQHLCALHIITLYQRLKRNPDLDIYPRTFIFGGKAAPGYFMAKLIIKFINSIAHVVNNDTDVRGRLKVVFMPNFNVSLGQKIYPAADLSEQISTAGKEASGTGNMKFAMNGALTIGTLDGANIEIREEAGEDNFFLFGLTAEEVYRRKAEGYYAMNYYEGNEELRDVIDSIRDGYFSHGDTELFRPIVDSLLYDDPYMLLADYHSYVECQKQVAITYRDQKKWTKMSILNSARMGKFSSDRTIREYCDEIWHVKPVPIELFVERGGKRGQVATDLDARSQHRLISSEKKPME